jgi:hypothetical protein
MQQGDEEGILESSIANCINLKHHYPSTVWGGGGANALNAYLQIVDRLQSVNNRGALFVKRVGDICMGRPGGAALLTTEEEGDLQAS